MLFEIPQNASDGSVPQQGQSILPEKQVFSILADSTLFFQVQLIDLERLSLFNRIYPILQFAVWPLGLFAVVWYMYNKINAAIQKEERERKPDRKSSRKKR